MNIGLLGINFGWGLQMANMSAIYEYLGANPAHIPILWLAAPLTGLLIQPLIGYFSDHTWSRFGRRKPYIFFGGILATLALFLMPECTTLWAAAILLWVLDATVNVSMGPFRALVPDLLPQKQQTKGYLVQGICIALGTVIASLMPWTLQHVFHVAIGHAQNGIPNIVKYAFWIGALLFIASISWTCYTTREYPPLASREKRLKQNNIKTIVNDIRHMPHAMRELAFVMMFSWMGLFCMFLFFPIAVATNIFHGHPGGQNYLNGIEWAGLCFSLYSGFFLLVSFILPSIAKRYRCKTIHTIALIIGGLALSSTLWIQTPLLLLIVMLGVGIAFASMQTMPYAMLAEHLPEDKMGTYMGIFNLFIVIPEIIVSLGFGFIMSHWLHNDRLLAVVIGGLCMVFAGVLTIRVKAKMTPAAYEASANY